MKIYLRPSHLGRTNLRHIRTLEIFEAFAKCIAQKGIQATSMEDVSTQAEMKRSIIRHYLGNREDLIEAFAEYYYQKCQTEFEESLAAISHKKNVPQELLRTFFPDQPQQGTETVLIIENLIAYSATSPTLLTLSNQYIEFETQALQTILKKHYTSAPAKEAWNVAYGIIGLWFNQESLIALQQKTAFQKAAKASAKTLLNSLE